MRKAFACVKVFTRLYIRSGRILFPLLILIGYPMIFYHVLPVEKVSSFSMSTVEAFVWGAWVTLAALWSEEKTLQEIFRVKAGQQAYFLAQLLWMMLYGAVGGIFLVVAPLLAHWVYLPDMFVQRPAIMECALAMLLNACAGICGASFGALFRPRFIQDRKTAYPLCLFLGLMGLVDGLAGFPFALRIVLPPMYDTIVSFNGMDTLSAQVVLPAAIWYCAYSAVCAAVHWAILRKTES